MVVDRVGFRETIGGDGKVGRVGRRAAFQWVVIVNKEAGRTRSRVGKAKVGRSDEEKP